ncbi:hypothetical protein BC829DRAFT_385998 [Chytridium lagenaria]|nr:hypothetical protein BC829DRAFT_385998 [Chytridium lagenaria]
MLLTLATELIEKCLSPLHPTRTIPLYMRQVQSINWSHLNIYYYTAMIILGQRAPMVSLEMFTDPSNCPFKSRVIGTPTKSFDPISRALISAFDIYDLKLAKAPRDTFSWIYIVDDLPFLQRLSYTLRYRQICRPFNIDTVNILQESFAGTVNLSPDVPFMGKWRCWSGAMSRSAISADQSVFMVEFLLENSKVAGEEVKVEAAQAVLNSNLVHMLVDEPKKRERILALLWG